MNPIASFLASTVGKIVLAAALVLIAVIAVQSCADARDDAATARQQGAESEALADSAADAVNIVIARQGAEATVDSITDEAIGKLDRAETPAERRAAVMSALCSMKLYAKRPECAVIPATP